MLQVMPVPAMVKLAMVYVLPRYIRVEPPETTLMFCQPNAYSDVIRQYRNSGAW